MAVPRAVQEFLRQSNVAYTVFPHRPAFTAAEEAEVTHTPGFRWAKTVACFADGRPILAVLPAPYLVDQERLAEAADAGIVRLAREDELEWLFPDCEPGAMPPFGPMYRHRVFLEKALALEPIIAFHAGTHTDAIRMHVDDFVNLVRPVMARFGERVAQTVP
jgi:Ala-tRNA(Pro) deacylase